MRQRDPKLRPYRAAMWATYFAAVLLGLLLGLQRRASGEARV